MADTEADTTAEPVQRPRRRWLRAGLVSVVLLLVLLVAADRIAAKVATDVLAQRIRTSQHLEQTPNVHIGGFPFLTQVLAGRYGDVSTTVRGVDANGLRISALAVHLHGVHISAASALRHSVASIPVDRASGDALLSYADINTALKPQGVVVSPAGGGGLSAKGTVSVAGLTVTVSGSGDATVVPKGIKLTVSHLSVSGLPSALTSLLGDGLTFTIPTASLPFGLQLRSVSAGPTGLAVSAAGSHISLPGR